jgi:hypothetical protein
MPARNCTLGESLRRWLVRQGSDEIAERFSPWIQRTLQDLGYDPDRAATDEGLQEVKALLRRADITPARMQRACREARRAEAQGLSVLEWTRGIQERAYSEAMAEKASQRAKVRLEREFEEEASTLDAPPTPKEVLAFLLVWEELGGSPALAALQEIQSQDAGVPPQN